MNSGFSCVLNEFPRLLTEMYLKIAYFQFKFSFLMLFMRLLFVCFPPGFGHYGGCSWKGPRLRKGTAKGDQNAPKINTPIKNNVLSSVTQRAVFYLFFFLFKHTNTIDYIKLSYLRIVCRAVRTTEIDLSILLPHIFFRR